MASGSISEQGNKQAMSVLIAQLEQLLHNAKRIKSNEFTEVIKDYSDIFERYSFRLRPSVGSISLVSCSSSTPQLGFSNMTSGPILQKTLERMREGNAQLEPPSRPTPEKSVQSWLISQAMQNAGRVESIEDAVADGHSYWFVSDEIALNAWGKNGPEKKRERVVADMLLIRVNSQGESEIVNVELKSKRTAETHGQIHKFWHFMGPDQVKLWREFAEVMLGGNKPRWKEVGGSRGLVIWPEVSEQSKPNERTIRLMSEYKSKGIDTICYSGPKYIFQPEYSFV
jgi:hypothetical protein